MSRPWDPGGKYLKKHSIFADAPKFISDFRVKTTEMTTTLKELMDMSP
jgi:hypothetical protein